MGLEEYNKSGPDIGVQSSRCAQSEVSDGVSEAPSLPDSGTQVLGPSGKGTVSPESVHTKVLPARSTTLQITGLKKEWRVMGGRRSWRRERPLAAVAVGVAGWLADVPMHSATRAPPGAGTTGPARVFFLSCFFWPAGQSARTQVFFLAGWPVR
jgi:hypothetical protein